MAKLLKRLRSGSKESLKQRLKELENKLHTQDEWYNRLERKNKELYEDNLILKREKDELLKRLSKVAGDHMMKGNPGIADLSDQNRPSKLGDKWTTLYTDEWTDAYEELRHDVQRTQPKTIEKQLLDIVVFCYKKCHEIAEDQMKRARISMNGFEHYLIDDYSLDRNKNVVSPSLLPRTTRVGEMFIDEVISNYKERRKHDIDWIQSVKKKLVNMVSQKGMQLPYVLDFTAKCAELCWFMCIQEPPLAIEYDNLEGKVVDRSKFNLYDRTGTITDFVVWPALLLHKNGPVLSKGAIQPVQTYKHPPGYNQIQNNLKVPEHRLKSLGKSARIQTPSKEQEKRVHSSRFPDKHQSSFQGDRISKSSENSRDLQGSGYVREPRSSGYVREPRSSGYVREQQSSGHAREPQKQGIIYYNEKANLILNDRVSPGFQSQYPFAYNLANKGEVTVKQSPRPRVANFDERVLIGRNKTSIVTQHSRPYDFTKPIRTQRIVVANQTEV